MDEPNTRSIGKPSLKPQFKFEKSMASGDWTAIFSITLLSISQIYYVL